MRKGLRKGLVHIYTGNGKGKTTAALGLALRASGAGLKVCIFQFIKGRRYCEIDALSKIENIDVMQCGRGCFIKGRPQAKDIELARRGIDEAGRIIVSGAYDVVILDEVNIAVKLGLVEPGDVIEILKRRPPSVELVLTGRCCPNYLFKYADVVTDMREVKHPYKKGIFARRGIEY